MTDQFTTRLERWKRALIDLTKRNRLLNYNPSRVTTIQVLSDLPAEVFLLLQTDGKAMKFLPAQNGDITSTIGQDRFLHTRLSGEKLNDSLLRIFRKSSSLFEEQGISTLFLAIGILEWYESESEDNPETPFQAPILLLPVELSRKVAWQDFSLRAHEDDPVVNPALIEQLRLAYNLLLPELPENLDEFDLEKFFTDIEQIIVKQKGWKVKREIYLDFFSFQKFLMYKDMERYEQNYRANHLIQALCTTTGTRSISLPEEIQNADLDRALAPESTFHVLDADSSQQRAILTVKSKYDLIIEGPPGTGKSQTITNLIADALADGKTVLFVSEKMAALEVVYKRLEAIGLHDFCLQLHSHKTNKRAVYDEFIRVLDNSRPADHTKDSDLNQLGLLKDLLNKYARDLHTPFGKLGQKPFDIFGQLALVLGKTPLMEASIHNIQDVTEIDFLNTCTHLQDLVNILSELGDPTKHPWYGSELRTITNADLAALNEALNAAIKAYSSIVTKVDTFADQVGFVRAKTISEINTLCEAALTISTSPGIEETTLKSDKWDTLPAEAKELINHGSSFGSLKKEILEAFKPEILNLDLDEVCMRFKNYSNSWIRFIRVDYWKDRKFLLDYLLPGFQNVPAGELSSHLNSIKTYHSEKIFLEKQDTIGQDLFGKRWHGLDSNWDELKRYSEWLVRMRQHINAGILQEKAIDHAIHRSLNIKVIQTTIEHLQQELGYLVASLQELTKLGKFAGKYAYLLNVDGQIEEAQTWLGRLSANIQKLHQLTLYNDKLAICLFGIAGPMTKRFLEENREPIQLEKTFKRFFYERWLDLVFSERPRLAAFTSLIHEQKIGDFRDLDFKSLKLARQRLLHKLYTKRETELVNPILSIELGTLQRELRKKARHIPLRKLFAKVPNITRAVKPCFMMSPMSAALFLDPNISMFDLVIFDEASQVPTEDAVGSLMRAKQAVVVGDPKQLPPTNFFQMQVLQADEQANEDESILDDVDSVLDEFVSIGFPKQSLLWHYRSQHESLIEFSNRHFYKNLLTFPAPHNGDENLGLQFNFVGGKYTGQGVNPIEAKAVADAVCEHIKNYPDLSLGVGTFNMNQQQLILDELEQRRRENPELEFFFSKKGEDQFFVKNLENIQGDERDVIFISITYGPDETGRIKYNFGPVNGENGWRRLNVIFTRARRCLKVFSSMRGDAIDPVKVQSQGARLLRDFLIFAEKRQKDVTLNQDHIRIDAPLERSIYEELTKRGLQLIPSVGHSGYRIDFGVVDPDQPNRFLVGLECDGANYYSASTARDRDRLRQHVLENLGWKLIRVWSVDWWRDKDGQINRVLRFIKETHIQNNQLAEDRDESTNSEKSNTEDTKSATNLSQDTFDPAIQDITAPTKAFGKTYTVVHSQTEDKLAPSVPPYRLTLLSPYGNAEDFLEAPDATVKEALLRVLAREAPIHVNELTKRVASYWEITRLNKQTKDKLSKLIAELIDKQQLTVKEEFAWGIPEPMNIVRNRFGLDYVFDPDSICIEEYEQAVNLILESYGTRIKESIVQDVARLLGFSRTGKKITQRVSDIIKNLIDNNKIVHVATGLMLVKGPQITDMTIDTVHEEITELT